MKKTIHIHLGGMPFVIEEDAYEILNDYLKSLKAKFEKKTESDEIVQDFEYRIAEVFAHKLGKTRQVILDKDVADVIQQLGRPEELGTPLEEEEKSNSSKENKQEEKEVLGGSDKKLFRDADNKVVGGVISGLCHYFGWDEPTWARIAFLLLVWFSGGTMILIYFMFVLIVPKAQTTVEKLQMKGKPVTIDTLEKEVKDAAKRTESFLQNTFTSSTFLNKIITLLMVIITGFAKFFALLVFLLSLIFLMVYAGIFSGVTIFGLSEFSDYVKLIFDQQATYWLMASSLLIVIGIPLFFIMYACVSFIFSTRVNLNRNLSFGLLSVWVLSFIALAVSGFNFSTKFASNSTLTREIDLNNKTAEILYIKNIEDSLVDEFSNNIEIDLEEEGSFNFGNFKGKTENGFIVNVVDIELKPTAESVYKVEANLKAKGKSKADAVYNTKWINNRIEQSDSTLKIPMLLEIFKNAKWRNQELKYTVYIPSGKRIKIDDVRLGEIRILDKDFSSYTSPSFINENGVIKCQNCIEQDSTEPEEVEENI